MWGSLIGVIVAIFMTLVQRILTLEKTLDAWLSGVRSMLQAMIILVLAWSLAAVADALGTGEFLKSTLAETLPVWSLPVLVFLLAAITAFRNRQQLGCHGHPDAACRATDRLGD